MALIKCPECGKEISDKASNCILCGCPIRDVYEAQDTSPSTNAENEAVHITIHGTVFDLNRLLMSQGDDIAKATKALARHTGISKDDAKKYITDGVNALPAFDKKELKARKKMGRNSLQISETLKTEERETHWQRLVREARDGQARCPRCRSTSLAGAKKGFGVGKAVVGAAIIGPLGLMAGNAGAKKMRVTCLKCGKQFWAGK